MSFAVEVFHYAITVRFINLLDLVLAEEVEDIDTRYNAVSVSIYPLKCGEWLEFWQRCKFLPLILYHLFSFFESY